jgi:hypothetical protein
LNQTGLRATLPKEHPSTQSYIPEFGLVDSLRLFSLRETTKGATHYELVITRLENGLFKANEPDEKKIVKFYYWNSVSPKGLVPIQNKYGDWK